MQNTHHANEREQAPVVRPKGEQNASDRYRLTCGLRNSARTANSLA